MAGGALFLADDKPLLAALGRLDDQLRRQVFTQAIHAGQVILRDAMRERAPVKTGHLRQQIGIRGSSRRKYSTAGRVTVGKAFYALFLERGHYQGKSHGSHRKKRDYTSGGEGRKWIAPRPFLGPALAAVKTRALAAMEHTLRDGVEQATRAVRAK